MSRAVLSWHGTGRHPKRGSRGMGSHSGRMMLDTSLSYPAGPVSIHSHSQLNCGFPDGGELSLACVSPKLQPVVASIGIYAGQNGAVGATPALGFLVGKIVFDLSSWLPIRRNDLNWIPQHHNFRQSGFRLSASSNLPRKSARGGFINAPIRRPSGCCVSVSPLSDRPGKLLAGFLAAPSGLVPSVIRPSGHRKCSLDVST